MGSIPHTGKKRKACRLLVNKTDGKITWKIRYILLDNIKKDLTGIDCGDMYYTVSSFVVMVKNLSFHNNSKITRTYEYISTFGGIHYARESVNQIVSWSVNNAFSNVTKMVNHSAYKYYYNRFQYKV